MSITVEQLVLLPSLREAQAAAGHGGELAETLSVYLLDTDMSMSQTAERLFLHKNTINTKRVKITAAGDLAG